MAKWKKKRDPLERLLARVEKTASECWLYTGGSKGKSGYGSFGIVPCRPITAHRASWLLHNGPIPDGQCVLHRCDVRRCINPAHLFLGTKGENSADMVAKSRQAKGSRHPNAKISESDVVEIRRRAADGERIASIGRAFGINWSSVHRILRGDGWRHVVGGGA